MNCGLKTESGKPWAISSIYYATILGTLSSKVFEKSGFHAAILNKIMTTTQNKSFSGLLQIMGLASAIGCQIHMIYPDTKHRMLSLLNGVYSPREVSSINNHRSIVIMWTSMSRWPDRSKMFTVDHFVPMLPTLTAEEIGMDSGWTLIKTNENDLNKKSDFLFKLMPVQVTITSQQLISTVSQKRVNLSQLCSLSRKQIYTNPVLKVKQCMHGNLRCHFLEKNGTKKEIPRQRIQVIIMK